MLKVFNKYQSVKVINQIITINPHISSVFHKKYFQIHPYIDLYLQLSHISTALIIVIIYLKKKIIHNHEVRMFKRKNRECNFKSR